MLKMMESVLLGLSEMEMNDLLTTYKYVCYVTHLMVIGKFFFIYFSFLEAILIEFMGLSRLFFMQDFNGH